MVAADTGRPVKRARVFITAAELPGGRGVLTDDAGVFDFTELPAGRYTLTVSKSGFVSLSYGQRRPLQAGTPLQLADGQQLKGIDFRLPRGSVIARPRPRRRRRPDARRDGPRDALPVQQGNRRLVPAGTAQTDDQGAVPRLGSDAGRLLRQRASCAAQREWPRRRAVPADRWRAAEVRRRAAGWRRRGRRGGVRRGRDAPTTTGAGRYAPTYYPGVAVGERGAAVTVGLSQEVLDINFSMLLVRTARITGHVTNPDGTPTTSGNVNLVPEIRRPRRAVGMQLRRPHSVGRRVLDRERAAGPLRSARAADDGETPQFGTQPLSVNGEDVTDLTVVLSPGATISGTVTFQPRQSRRRRTLTQVRIVGAVDRSVRLRSAAERARRQGRPLHARRRARPARTWIRRRRQLRGWALKSVTVDGRDVTDTPLEVAAVRRSRTWPSSSPTSLRSQRHDYDRQRARR